MPINRRIITIIVAVFAIAFFSGCTAQDEGGWKKIDKPLETEVQEMEVEEEVPAEEVPEVKVPEPEPTLVIPKKQTAPEEAVSDVKAEDLKYVLAKKCKKCHIKQFKSWEKTTMAKSFENLKPGVNAEAKKKAGIDPDKDYTADADCLRCHTTGYGKPGGFVSLATTPDLINVQCEACHGPGSEYIKIMKKHRKTFKKADIAAVGHVFSNSNKATSYSVLQ